MKHLNNYKIFESMKEYPGIGADLDFLQDIDVICKHYDIHDYTINSDGSIDVDGDVEFYNKYLEKLPLKFNKVSGCFDCSYNKLTSLEGCPKYVGTHFLCYNNKITSLEGCPEYVNGGGFVCHENPIYSIVKYFISRPDKNNLVELFNYCDIVQDMNVIYDRLEYFYSQLNMQLIDNIFPVENNVSLELIKANGYKIIR